MKHAIKRIYMTLDSTFATSQGIAELTPMGCLRAAINFGNPILAVRDPESGEAKGVSVDLAMKLAGLLDVSLQLVLYDSAGDVVTGCERGEWDVAFVARDPVRGKAIDQTRPYVLIEGAYLVPEVSPIRSNDEVDAIGTRVVVGNGSAYDLYLTRVLHNATLVRAATSPAVVDTMLAQGCEVAAGVRQQLEFDANRLSGLRMLPGQFMVIEQAMGTPKGRPAAFRLLNEFVVKAIEFGFVSHTLVEHGILGATVATV
ncbi:TPA: transporter substrate-binding domain-containing protein [Burkholderia cenocepacia]|uniref:transporter substrate-binding domain-containing protein n=1 Tax=Burkholderia cenocepacia TaxID=95486 RepID=UPI0031FCF9E3